MLPEGGYESSGFSANNNGEVVGLAFDTVPDPYSLGAPGFYPTQTRAFLWQKGTMQDLGTLGGNDAAAFFVNDRGQITGQSYTNTTPNQTTGLPTADPFFWQNNRMLDIGSLGGTLGSPSALNNKGQVVGVSNMAGDLTSHPFLWSKKTGRQDLGTLGGNNGVTNWINDNGDIAGKADLPGPAPQNHDAVLWRRNGAQMIDLGVLPGDSCANAYYVNSRGQVVGTSENSDLCRIPTGEHAFLWENGGPMVDLNSLIPPSSSLQLVFAFAINDEGEIVGVGVPLVCTPDNTNPCSNAFVLIPCNDDHPGIEGCDYSMVDGSTATTAIISAPTTKVTSPITQCNPTFRGAMNPMLRRFGPRYGVWSGRGVHRPMAGSVRDLETIPSPDSALQIDDLISTRARAEIAAEFALTSDAAAHTNLQRYAVSHPNTDEGGWVLLQDDVIGQRGDVPGVCGITTNNLSRGWYNSTVFGICAARRSPAYPTGALAKRPGWVHCTKLGYGRVDFARGCSAT